MIENENVFKVIGFLGDEGHEWESKFLTLNGIEFEEHLKTANTLYFTESSIFNTIKSLTVNHFSLNEKINLLEKLKARYIVIDYFKSQNGMATIYTSLGEIIFKLLSETYPIFIDAETDYRTGLCFFASKVVSKIIEQENEVVRGYIYTVSDKAKFGHEWIEYTDEDGHEWIIDYTWNVIMNKRGYYILTHAEPITRTKKIDVVIPSDNKGNILTPETLITYGHKLRQNYDEQKLKIE